MLRVRTNHAKAGMELAMPVYHPRRHDTLLLKAGVRLEDRTIARLREMNLPELWIRYPLLEQISEYVNPAVFAERARLSRQIADAFDTFGACVDAELDFVEFRSAMNDMISLLVEQPRTAIYLSEIVESGQPMLRHAANVGFISVLMGLKLGFYLVKERSRLAGTHAKSVANLGVAGVLHDIGMLRLDEETLLRWNTTSDESDPAWREHVKIGYNLVRGELEPSAAAAVLHHHQRFDGTGFPQRVTFSGEEVPIEGSDIHIFARIVAAADLFNRTKHPASAPGAEVIGRPSIPTVRALKMMLTPPMRDWVDPVVLRGLLSVVPAYAPGTIVRLNSGVRAVVIGWSPLDPCRPEIHEIDDSDELLDPSLGGEIDLREFPDEHIVEADGEDVSEDNFAPAKPDDFDIGAIARRMINGAEEAEQRRRLAS